ARPEGHPLQRTTAPEAAAKPVSPPPPVAPAASGEPPPGPTHHPAGPVQSTRSGESQPASPAPSQAEATSEAQPLPRVASVDEADIPPARPASQAQAVQPSPTVAPPNRPTTQADLNLEVVARTQAGASLPLTQPFQAGPAQTAPEPTPPQPA